MGARPKQQIFREKIIVIQHALLVVSIQQSPAVDASQMPSQLTLRLSGGRNSIVAKAQLEMLIGRSRARDLPMTRAVTINWERVLQSPNECSIAQAQMFRRLKNIARKLGFETAYIWVLDNGVEVRLAAHILPSIGLSGIYHTFTIYFMELIQIGNRLLITYTIWRLFTIKMVIMNGVNIWRNKSTNIPMTSKAGC